MYKRRTKSDIKFIAVDWGSSNFRAYAIDAEGNVRQRTKAHQGVLRIKEANFAGTLKRLLGKWFNKYPGTPLLMSGMIASHHGWQEVEYVEAPLRLLDLASYVEKIFNHRFERDIYLVPGIKVYRKNNISFDEMRGKEVQIFGALENNSKAQKQIICLPGTHSKWVQVDDGVITNFHTFMTGEIISLLTRNSILNAFMQGTTYDRESFAKGLELAQESDHLLSDLYTVYTEGLAENIPQAGLSSYLSALVIASEMKSAQQLFPDMQDIMVVGAPWLIDMYQQACDTFSISMQGVKSDVATVAGLIQVYDAMGTANAMPQEKSYNF